MSLSEENEAEPKKMPQYKLIVKMGPNGTTYGCNDLSAKCSDGQIEIQVGRDDSPGKGWPANLKMSKEAATEFARDILSACVEAQVAHAQPTQL